MSKLVKFNSVGYIYRLTETNILLTDMPTQYLVISISCNNRLSNRLTFRGILIMCGQVHALAKKFFYRLRQNDSRPCT